LFETDTVALGPPFNEVFHRICFETVSLHPLSFGFKIILYTFDSCYSLYQKKAPVFFFLKREREENQSENTGEKFKIC